MFSLVDSKCSVLQNYSTLLSRKIEALCTGDPHDRDAPTDNPHDDGEHGNPHDSGGKHDEGDNCHGAQ